MRHNGYKQYGNGPRKVMLLSGWFGSSADWAPLAPALDTDACTYVGFDYRGYGESRDRTGEFTFAEAAQDVIALADHLGWARFSLVGHSMGGMAMQRVLLAAPDRIERMAGISPVPACGSRMDPGRLAGFEAAVHDVAKRQAIIAYSTGNRLAPQWCAHLARASMASSRREAFAAFLPQWATHDFSAQVAGNPIPVKLFIGEFDPNLTLALMAQTWCQWYPNAQVEVLANAGHYAMQEVPAALATALNVWLAEQPTR